MSACGCGSGLALPPSLCELRRTSRLARTTVLPVPANDRAHSLIGAEILGAVDIKQRGELRARAIDAAFDGADRAAADRRRVLIGEAACADQDQRLALVLRQLVERGAEFLELQMRALRRLRLQHLGIVAFGILDLAPPLPVVRAKQVAQDREQPRRQVRARLERDDMRERPQQGLLHQIVGAIGIAAERDRERTQARYGCQNVVAKGISEGHYSLPSLLLLLPPVLPTWEVPGGVSSLRIRSAKRSGTPWRTTSSYIARS